MGYRVFEAGELGYILAMASVVHLIVGLGNGGAEKTLRKITSLDQKNFHSVISLAGPGHHGGPIRAHGGHLHCMGMNFWNWFGVVSRMRRLRCLKEADVVTAWMPHAIVLMPFLVAPSSRAKLVINLRASSYGRRFTDFVRKLFLTAWSALYGKSVDLIITPGKNTAAAHHSLRLDEKKFAVIPNGFMRPGVLETQERPPINRSVVSHCSQVSNVFRIGMFARWHPQKNHLGFLKALFLLSQSGVDFKAVFAGADVDWANRTLTKAIERYGLAKKVELLGDCESLADILTRIDIHVVASAYGEAFPNVAGETMLEGIPNIVTDVGDSATVVGSTGWLVEPGDSVGLYEALKDAEASREELRHRGKRAAERIRSLFPVGRMVDSYSKLFEDLGDQNNGP